MKDYRLIFGFFLLLTPKSVELLRTAAVDVVITPRMPLSSRTPSESLETPGESETRVA